MLVWVVRWNLARRSGETFKTLSEDATGDKHPEENGNNSIKDIYIRANFKCMGLTPDI